MFRRSSTKEEANAVEVFNEYTQTACDSFNACRYSIAKMIVETDANSKSKFMEDFLGEGEELREWRGMHEEKQRLITEVMCFADATTKKMKVVQSRMKNKAQKTFQDCYRGFSSEEAASKAKVLQEHSLQLRKKILDFYERIQVQRGTTIEKEKFKQVVAGVLLITGACCGMIVLTANPQALAVDSLALRVGAASVMDRAFEKSTAQLEKSLAALPTKNHVEQFTKGEVDRAVAFLEGVESKPINDKIHHPVQMVYSDTTILTSSVRAQCNRNIEKIIQEGEKLSKTCQSTQTSADHDHDAKVKKSVGILLKIAHTLKGAKAAKVAKNS